MDLSSSMAAERGDGGTEASAGYRPLSPFLQPSSFISSLRTISSLYLVSFSTYGSFSPEVIIRPVHAPPTSMTSVYTIIYYPFSL